MKSRSALQTTVHSRPALPTTVPSFFIRGLLLPIVPAALSIALAGCAVPQGVTAAIPSATLLQATTDAAQFRSAQPRDARRGTWVAVRGEACRTMLSWPLDPPTVFLGSAAAASLLPWPSIAVLWGNAGYRQAVRRASDSAGGATLFDVRADLHTTAVLGVWRRECVEVHALAQR